MEVNVCVRKQSSYMKSPSYFAILLQTLYFCYSMAFVHRFELEKPWHLQSAKLIAEYRAESSQAPLFHTPFSNK